MRIDVWADVVCPWCYLGLVRLERALAETGREAEVVQRAFQLDPSAVRGSGQTVAEMLGERYGGGVEAGREMVARVVSLAAAEGLAFVHDRAPVTNTADAHRVLQLALAEAGVPAQRELARSLFAAYFERAEDPADPAVLVPAAEAAGLAGERVRAVLASSEYAAEVAADQQQAAAYGATGVPFFVVDGRYAVSGAQPTATFVDLLARV